jgi:hypothetical protein
MAKPFRPNKNHAVALSILNSAPAQRAVREAAQRGLTAYRGKAATRTLTGEFLHSGHLVDTTAWDGRKGVRIESRTDGVLSIEAGTEDTEAVHALEAARLAAGQGSNNGQVI